MSDHRLASALFGVLLVFAAATTGVAPSAVGTARGGDWFDTCHVGPVIMVDVTDSLCPDAQTKNLRQADALETEKNIWASARTQIENNDVLLQTYQNYLNDTASIARMIGKNAYIKALNNGATKAEAKVAAQTAIADYYATKQKQLIAIWNTTVSLVNRIEHTADNTKGVSDEFVSLKNRPTCCTVWVKLDATVNLTLVNGTTVKSHAFKVMAEDGASASNQALHMVSPGRQKEPFGELKGIQVEAPTTGFSTSTIAKPDAWTRAWNAIETQHQQVQSQLNTFINVTYQKYQAGEINTTQLVDPYLGAREYAPANSSRFSTWTLRTLTAMGMNPPENLSSIGQMTILDDSKAYTGILMSEDHPEGGYVVGKTYNASRINGSQFVAELDGGTHTLKGKFTVQSVQTTSGKTLTNTTITYTNVNYAAANTTEYQKLMEKLNRLTAKINARQQRLRNMGGGGFSFGFGGLGTALGFGIPMTAILLGFAVLAATD